MDEIRASIDTLEQAVRVELDRGVPGDGRADGWQEAVIQLHWLLGIVERDNHGGNRQALGQYGLLVAESLRQHLQLPDPAPGSVTWSPAPALPGVGRPSEDERKTKESRRARSPT